MSRDAAPRSDAIVGTLRDDGPIRLGMITPSSNTVLEPVTYSILGARADATAHFSRVPVTRITPGRADSSQFDVAPMVRAGRLLAEAEVNVIAWNGTSGSWLGIEHDRYIVTELSRQTGIAATTSTLALMEAFQAFGIGRLSLVTPYTVDVNNLIASQYSRHGVDVVAESHLGITDNESFGRIDPRTVAAQIRRVASDADAVAVVCTNTCGAVVVGDLEEELGVPILDSVAVTLWGALRSAGSSVAIEGWGSLLRDGAIRATLQDACDVLRNTTGSDRVTVHVESGLHMALDVPVAESVAPSARSMRHERNGEDRSHRPIAWIEAHRVPLLQPSFEGEVLAPPRSMTERFQIAAQMLAPLQRRDKMHGWVSVHNAREREWSDHDLAALRVCVTTIEAALG